ncbi:MULTISPECIES: hypothetical protein [unclassified Pseudofrankia]|uniref:hypothetical protein n=1 Tax=unclassified Pseudofrankia TaxID=2994372 RepID=UPI0008D936CB|nr:MULTISPECIES: hypothetical protein [unclassified Pseudofrankia]MDT3444956.1 hypothetical protein [Pseudofrankia sp. BMG5.37]OHV47338.1 hypothetical protein BCD48_18380 [Pseudofrankia sp. BMG5.36]
MLGTVRRALGKSMFRLVFKKIDAGRLGEAPGDSARRPHDSAGRLGHSRACPVVVRSSGGRPEL